MSLLLHTLGLALLATVAHAEPVAWVRGDAENGTHRLFVASESSDEVHELAFEVERQIFRSVDVVDVGSLPTEIEGPHGLTVAPDGKHWFLTLAHGKPFGVLAKFATGTNRLVGSCELGLFPATMQISRDTGLLYCVNFDLHGDMTPSSVSVVDPDDLVEVARTETGPMPHGSRLSSDGRMHYSCAMMSDELIELDAGRFEVTRRLRLGDGTGRRHRAGDHARTKPTWVQPHPSERLAYVCLNGAAQVVEVDLDRWRVRRRFPTAKGPYNLELTPGGETLIVTHKGGASVGIWDLESGEERARVDTTRRVPHGVAITPDGRYAFVSNESVGGERGTVDAIDIERAELVASIEVGLQAGGIAYWKHEAVSPESEAGGGE